MLRAFAEHLEPGGRLVLVVPSLESVLLAEARLRAWQATGSRAAAAEARARRRNVSLRSVARGVVGIDGAATKHYRAGEIEGELRRLGFDRVERAKVSYAWDTEFDAPRAFRGAPHPFDWILVARRAARRATVGRVRSRSAS
jgi:hypothetical protein